MTANPSPREERPLGPGRTVWLASYPKSGNTWMRAIVTALSTHRHLFGVNQLGSGAQPNHIGMVQPSFGIDPRWLSRDEVDRMRTVLVNRWGVAQPTDDSGEAAADETPLPPPVLRKTHETYRPGRSGREPFPLAATRAAILVVRDPRDVACSYAPFFGVDLDGAVDAMAREGHGGAASPAMAQTEQPWGSWSSHGASWLAGGVPFPVHLVRYEDLKHDTVGTLLPVFDAIGLPCTEAELLGAAEQTRFDRLQKSESERGFRETSKKTKTFFRKGAAGGWRDELSEAQVAALEADHADMMTRLGYELTTADASRRSLAESRASRRRAERHDWMRLPESMGIEVVRGDAPEEIPDAQRTRPWIQVNDHQTLVTFTGGTRLLVEDGAKVTVGWTPDPDRPQDDPSWLVQGWGVTLVMLQRGDLSLHAATVRIGDEIVAIAGHRGAGKSTTSMALRGRGHQLLVDDVTLIEFRGDEAWTTPYSRNVHLLPDAAEALGVDFEALPMLAGGRTKVAFRPEEPTEEPHRIDRIVVLAPGPKIERVTITEARGGQKLASLLAHTRRDGLAPLILGQARYFELMTRLSNAVPVQVLRRPKDDWTLDEVLDLVETGVAQDSA